MKNRYSRHLPLEGLHESTLILEFIQFRFVIYRAYAYLCSMNYNDHKDNAKSFRALTGLSHEQFSALLPYFEAAHEDYLSEYEMNGKRRSGQRRSPSIYRNSPLPGIPDRLFFMTGRNGRFPARPTGICRKNVTAARKSVIRLRTPSSLRSPAWLYLSAIPFRGKRTTRRWPTPCIPFPFPAPYTRTADTRDMSLKEWKSSSPLKGPKGRNFPNRTRNTTGKFLPSGCA